jgi:Trk-type K+ transport system membrane component
MNPETESSFEELKRLLRQNIALSEQNNRILRSIRNSARFQSFIRLIYIVIIVGALIWTFQFLRPYLEGIRSTYESYQETQSQLQNTINKYLPGKNP